MKILIKIFLIFTIVFWLSYQINYSFAWNTQLNESQLNIWIWNIENWNNHRNDILNKLKENGDKFFGTTKWWVAWTHALLLNIAKSLKNIFFILAWLYLLIIVIKVLTWVENAEENYKKFKSWILWISIWLFIIQSAYIYVNTIYNQYIWQSLANNIWYAIIDPLIWMLEVFASVVFLFMAILAFYKLITANWNEESIKKWKMTIVYAIIWFILIKLAKLTVDWVYAKINCDYSWVIHDSRNLNCIHPADVKWFAWKLLQVINWTNGFIWIIVILMIIYAWFQIMTASWDEDKMKKAKKSILYIFIWLFILTISYLIITFFIIPQTKWDI